jgi:DNA helicase-2/ATP-dependent DNA helicase PcrA
LRARLCRAAPDRYADETPSAVSRLKKHPVLLRLVERSMEDEVKVARAHLEERLGSDPEGAALLTRWDAEGALAPLARARATERAVPKEPVAFAHRAASTLREVARRLGDVHRILFELYTDAGRLQPLRDERVPDRATAGELDELVRWAGSQLSEEEPSELAGIDHERMAPVDGRPLDDSAEGDAARGRLDHEDDALLLRLYQLAHGHLSRVDGAPLIYDHVAIDEAQDLSAAEIQVLVCATGPRRSVTIAGDVAQRLVFDNSFRGWQALLADLSVPAARVEPLRLAYRSTAQVMQFAREVLGPLADPEPPTVARDGAEVALHRFVSMGEAVAFAAEALRSLLGREPSASVALITRHAGQADAWYAALRRAEVPHLRRVRREDFVFQPGIDVTDVAQVKGLEFDYVLLLDVNESSYPEGIEARHLLHIGATRATHQLWLIATGRESALVRHLIQPDSPG